MVVCFLVFRCFVTAYYSICVGCVCRGLRANWRKSVGGADWREGWFAVECGLLLNYFGGRSSFCFVDGGLFVRISGVWVEEGLDGKECIRDE